MTARGTTSIADRRVTVSTADRRLTASFAVGERDTPVVERGGALREPWADAACDLLVAAFAAACRRGRREAPDGLHVRATSSIAPSEPLELRRAAAVAGAVAANALLGLGLSHDDVVHAGEDAMRRSGDAGVAAGDPAISPAFVDGARITVRQSCPD